MFRCLEADVKKGATVEERLFRAASAALFD